MYSKACLFRPIVTLAYNNIGQSDIRHELTTNRTGVVGSNFELNGVTSSE